MDAIILRSMDNDTEFIEKFEAQSWPPERWRHRDHVRLAYLYLRKFPFDQALERIRTGIKTHNAAHGVPDHDTSGYHETMTAAWLTLVDAVLQEYGSGETADAFDEAHPELSQKKTLRLFYSKDLFMSPRAKVEFVEPDL